MTKGQTYKKLFVEGSLSETLSEACEWVSHLDYEVCEGEWVEEIVTIVCMNGHTYKVCVTGDSKAAIIADVMKEVMRH